MTNTITIDNQDIEILKKGGPLVIHSDLDQGEAVTVFWRKEK